MTSSVRASLLLRPSLSSMAGLVAEAFRKSSLAPPSLQTPPRKEPVPSGGSPGRLPRRVGPRSCEPRRPPRATRPASSSVTGGGPLVTSSVAGRQSRLPDRHNRHNRSGRSPAETCRLIPASSGQTTRDSLKVLSVTASSTYSTAPRNCCIGAFKVLQNGYILLVGGRGGGGSLIIRSREDPGHRARAPSHDITCNCMNDPALTRRRRLAISGTPTNLLACLLE